MGRSPIALDGFGLATANAVGLLPFILRESPSDLG